MPETTDGFATVGDMGWLDEDGYLYLADRRVDLIVSGGANVFPAEVETALIDHPGIADVVVIGLRDEEWGRRVHAVIEPRDPAAPPTLDDVVAFAKSRLAAYKVPKTIEIVEAIPRSAATKVNRGALVAQRGRLQHSGSPLLRREGCSGPRRSGPPGWSGNRRDEARSLVREPGAVSGIGWRACC